MKLLSLAALGLAAAASAMDCATGGTGSYNSYEITGNMPNADAPGTCGGLWDNLNGFSACTASSTWCGSNNDESTAFTWRFNTPIGCDPGMVEAAWWEATKNNYGGISC